MKFKTFIFLGPFLILAAQGLLQGCAPADETPVGSGGAVGAGGLVAGAGGLTAGAGGAGTGGNGFPSGGAPGAGGGSSEGIGGTAPMLTCGTAAGGASTLPPATFQTLQDVITGLTCDSSDCHGGHGDLGLSGTPDEIYDHLLSTVSDDCGGLKVIEPGDPDRSALVRLIKGPCAELAQMPDGCTCDPNPLYNNCVPAEYVVAIEQWVAAGAPKQ